MHHSKTNDCTNQGLLDVTARPERELISSSGIRESRKPRLFHHTLPFYSLAFSLTFLLTFISILDRDREDRESGSVVAEEISSGQSRRSDTGSIGHASRQVQRTITYGLMKHGTFEEASLNGGTGVLVSGLGAYWVKNSTVYALNGLAKSYSKGIEYGPPGLSKRDLLEALGR